MVRKFRVTGKSPQMRTVYFKEQGKMVQRGIKLGMVYEVTEDEMTFHVERQAAKRILKIEEITEEPEPVSEPAPAKKTKRSRSRKRSK